MKKTLLIAFACVMAFACTKNNVQDKEVSNGMVLSASMEQPKTITKATLNASLQTLWKTGDVIRVFVENIAGDWNTNAPFNLISGNGETSGSFRCATDYRSGNKWNTGAFFPYFEASTDNGSNIGGDKKMYFYLPESYSDYVSGTSYMPLIADLSGANTQPTSINFKHAGSAVVVSLTGVPGAAHSIGLTVTGKKIWGWFGGFAVTNAGTNTGVISATDGSNSTVWLNFDSSGNMDRDIKFIFPLPYINEAMNLTFTIYDKNNLKIWQKTASSQPAIGRCEALVMPERAVSAVPQDIYLAGYINGGDVYTVENSKYKFVDGQLTINLTSDSYVLLNQGGTGEGTTRYLLDAYSNSTDPVTFSHDNDNYDHKLKVPAGNKRFTLSYNSDGTITMSYANAI